MYLLEANRTSGNKINLVVEKTRSLASNKSQKIAESNCL